MLNIGNHRECFFDDYLLDTEKTTAELRLHELVRREVVMTHGEAWEGNGCEYHNFFFDDAFPGVDGAHPEGVYRMYYIGRQLPNGSKDCKPEHELVVCYAESPDCIHWTKPVLSISDFHGSKENNIVLGSEFGCEFDNFMVFRDDDPACPADERYKGISSYQNKQNPKPNVLYCYFSADGIHFRRGRVIADEDQGTYDTLNIVFRDERAGLYRAYVRGFHNTPVGTNRHVGIRDVRYFESRDGVNWTKSELLDFGDAEDYQLYTNCVFPYYRAPQMLLGLPTRYMEYAAWSETFDELCGAKERMTVEPRLGLAVTDCMFMCSRDGKKFFRFEDAFLRPAPENGENWLYGDCYPARGLVETPSGIEGEPNEISMFIPHHHFTNSPKELIRYTLRLDGFASLYAGRGKEETVTTKPFVYDGSVLRINFATSARGYLRFTLRRGEETVESLDTFGNSVDRRVVFPAGAVAAFSGKEVVMEIRMRDADLYSLRFAEK